LGGTVRHSCQPGSQARATGALTRTGSRETPSTRSNLLHRADQPLPGAPRSISGRSWPLGATCLRITTDELAEEARGQGISSLKQVQWAIAEASGSISFIPGRTAQAASCPSTAEALDTCPLIGRVGTGPGAGDCGCAAQEHWHEPRPGSPVAAKSSAPGAVHRKGGTSVRLSFEARMVDAGEMPRSRTHELVYRLAWAAAGLLGTVLASIVSTRAAG
jgi:Protein of unknown function (DUF421)